MSRNSVNSAFDLITARTIVFSDHNFLKRWFYNFWHILTAHAQKRRFRSFQSKIGPRHSLRRPRFPIRQMYFHYQVTFTGYTRCFCATTSRGLVTLTSDLLTVSVFHIQYLSCTTHIPILIILRLPVPALWITEFDRIFVIRNSNCACAVSPWPITGGWEAKWSTFWNPWHQFTYLLWHYQGATSLPRRLSMSWRK